MDKDKLADHLRGRGDAHSLLKEYLQKHLKETLPRAGEISRAGTWASCMGC